MNGINSNENEMVIIAYAANDNYLPYMGVSISSLIRHVSPDRMYKIYIFSIQLF